MAASKKQRRKSRCPWRAAHQLRFVFFCCFLGKPPFCRKKKTHCPQCVGRFFLFKAATLFPTELEGQSLTLQFAGYRAWRHRNTVGWAVCHHGDPFRISPPEAAGPVETLESWILRMTLGWEDDLTPRTKGHIEFTFTPPLCKKMRCQGCPTFFLGEKDIVFHPSRNDETLMKLWVPGKMIASRGLQLGSEYLNDADFVKFAMTMIITLASWKG